MPGHIASIMTDSWKANPAMRPSFAALIDLLNEYVVSHRRGGKGCPHANHGPTSAAAVPSISHLRTVVRYEAAGGEIERQANGFGQQSAGCQCVVS